MSVSLHMPAGHLPPRRIPPGRGVENGKSPLGGGGAGKEGEKKVNLHEDLAKIQNVAREQEEGTVEYWLIVRIFHYLLR